MKERSRRVDNDGMDQMESALEAPDAKISAKQLKRMLGTNRPLDAWERYRALNDAMDEAYEVVDISNREARFALILMGGLNAGVFVVATRAEFLGALNTQERLWAGVLLGIYALCAIYFLFQAIEALRPGNFRPHLGDWNERSDDYPKGVRYFEDVVQRDVQSHWQAWREVQMGQLNAELAIHLHSLCIKSNVKRVALRKLFAGLRLMTLLVTGLLMLFVLALWT